MYYSADNRMVGPPLHYYSYYYTPSRLVTPPEFTYFHKFDPYYQPRMDSTEELMFPPSPNSTQSDSDNSLSSVEVTPKEIQVIKNVPKNQEKVDVRCCWRSCGIVFPSLDQLATHVSKVHASGGPGGLFYCGWEGCTRNNKGFNARYKMLVHVRTHTNEKPHKCLQCEKSFSRAENLKIHSRSHSGEKPYVCTVPGCNKAYSNSSDRFKHTRTHQVEKPYQCKVPGCPKRYTDPSSLRKHVKTYKHFVNDNTNRNVDKTEKKPEELKRTEDRITQNPLSVDSLRQKSSICNCNRVCCVSNCLSNPDDIVKFGAFINLKEEDKSITWNKFFNPFLPQTKNMFAPYEIAHDNTMDIDTPLDLSIHRK